MMPEMDGFTLAKEIRKMNSKIPLIFLTAKTLKEDVLEGFRIGADDYLTKPFDSEVLLYKIAAILKRNAMAAASADEPLSYEVGAFHFDCRLRTLKLGKNSQTLVTKGIRAPENAVQRQRQDPDPSRCPAADLGKRRLFHHPQYGCLYGTHTEIPESRSIHRNP